jgi:hypothetical protein
MSPQFMASQSGCADACPCMPRLRRKIRLYQAAGFTLVALALAAIVASWPVEGLAGAGLALGGVAVLWTGWYLVVRRASQFKVELKAAASPRSFRGLNR